MQPEIPPLPEPDYGEYLPRNYKWSPLEKFKGPVVISPESDYLIFSLLFNSCANYYKEAEKVNTYFIETHCLAWFYVAKYDEERSVYYLYEIWTAPC